MQQSFLDELLSQGKALATGDWRATIAVSIISPFLFTYLLTSFWSYTALHRGGEGKDPPIAPYITPFVANLFSFAFDTKKFLTGILAAFHQIPVRIRIAHQYLFYISGPANILTMFRSSRDLTTVPSTIHVLEAGFGSPAQTHAVYERDNTGLYAVPLPGSNPIPAHERIHHITHRIIHESLTNVAPLTELANRFMSNLDEELYELDIGYDEWTEIDDFYGIIQSAVFKASTAAICGKHLFELNRDFAVHFWEFDRHLVKLFKRIPRWLAPNSYAVREKCLKAITKWHRFAKEEFDWDDEELLNTEYEDLYGAKMMRDRAREYGKIEGFGEEASAASDLGLIWGANANIIPTIGWMLIDILFRPDLLSRVRAELDSCGSTPTPAPSSPTPTNTIHLPSLMTLPLLQSIYAEELRLRASLMIARVPTVDSFKIGPWKFPRGKMIVASSWHESRDRAVWNEGRSGEYSVEEFWAERFLTYDGDLGSGPRRAKLSAVGSGSADGEGHAAKVTTPKFTTDTVTGSFIPYGGGQNMCPGRFYAKQEALGGVALFLREFDIDVGVGGSDDGKDGSEEQWKTWKQAKPELNMAFFAFGVIPPKGKVKARMRRRRGV